MISVGGALLEKLEAWVNVLELFFVQTFIQGLKPKDFVVAEKSGIGLLTRTLLLGSTLTHV